jgi:pimeloyl-ACP methyl ester carboxylesterase
VAYIEVEPGVRIFYRDLGRSDGRPIVLLHAFTFDHTVWDRHIRLLCDSHRLVPIDLRGHGLSDKPTVGCTPDRLVADVEAVLEALDLHDVALIGWSLGGAVAARLAARSDRVSQLMLITPFGPKFIADDRSPQRMSAAEAGGLVGYERSTPYELRLTTVQTMPKQPYSEAVSAWLYAMTMRAPSWSAGRILEEFVRADFRPDAASITVPTVICGGRADTSAPAAGIEEYHELIVGSELLWFEESGHSPQLEEFDEFVTVLEKYLERRN